ncbi:hypothetical protein EMIT0196MI5_210020 [Pseudomonas sp. IT-196MI5]
MVLSATIWPTTTTTTTTTTSIKTSTRTNINTSMTTDLGFRDQEEDDVAPFTREEQLAILAAARGDTWPQLRLHDATCWRASNVGRQAARPQRLDPDRQGSWPLAALR